MTTYDESTKKQINDSTNNYYYLILKGNIEPVLSIVALTRPVPSIAVIGVSFAKENLTKTKNCKIH